MRQALIRLSALAAALILGGCAESYVIENLESRYLAPEMPRVFATGRSGFYATGFAAANNQRPIRYRKDFQAYFRGGNLYEKPPLDSLGGLIDSSSDYRIDRDPFQMGGAFFYQGRSWFCGFTGGLGVPDLRDFGLGAFGGFSTTLKDFVPSASIGLYALRVATRGDYWRYSDWDDSYDYGGSSDNRPFLPGSSEGSSMDYLIPVKLGLLYRLAPGYSPYIGYTYQNVGFWPNEDLHESDYQVAEADFALGLRYEGFPFALVSVEVGYARARVEDSYDRAHFNSRVFLQKRLF